MFNSSDEFPEPFIYKGKREPGFEVFMDCDFIIPFDVQESTMPHSASLSHVIRALTFARDPTASDSASEAEWSPLAHKRGPTRLLFPTSPAACCV